MALKKQNGTDSVLLQSGDDLLLQDEPVGGTDVLLADDVESASEVSVPDVGQEHIILADDIESASQVSQPAVGQEHSLLADDVESSSQVSQPAIGQVHVLLAREVVIDYGFDDPGQWDIPAALAPTEVTGSTLDINVALGIGVIRPVRATAGQIGVTYSYRIDVDTTPTGDITILFGEKPLWTVSDGDGVHTGTVLVEDVSPVIPEYGYGLAIVVAGGGTAVLNSLSITNVLEAASELSSPSIGGIEATGKTPAGYGPPGKKVLPFGKTGQMANARLDFRNSLKRALEEPPKPKKKVISKKKLRKISKEKARKSLEVSEKVSGKPIIIELELPELNIPKFEKPNIRKNILVKTAVIRMSSGKTEIDAITLEESMEMEELEVLSVIGMI